MLRHLNPLTFSQKVQGKVTHSAFFLIFFIKYDGLVQVVYRATFDNQL